MSIVLFPTTAARLPRLLDDVFAEFDDIDRALRAHSKNQEAAAGQINKVVDDDSKLAVSLNVKGFKPDALTVNLEGRVLTVEGKEEVQGGAWICIQVIC
ncbi:hypothetical protein OSTOST_17849, partial [Ostertagia ostertagi]